MSMPKPRYAPFLPGDLVQIWHAWEVVSSWMPAGVSVESHKCPGVVIATWDPERDEREIRTLSGRYVSNVPSGEVTAYDEKYYLVLVKGKAIWIEEWRIKLDQRILQSDNGCDVFTPGE